MNYIKRIKPEDTREFEFVEPIAVLEGFSLRAAQEWVTSYLDAATNGARGEGSVPRALLVVASREALCQAPDDAQMLQGLGVFIVPDSNSITAIQAYSTSQGLLSSSNSVPTPGGDLNGYPWSPSLYDVDEKDLTKLFELTVGLSHPSPMDEVLNYSPDA